VIYVVPLLTRLFQGGLATPATRMGGGEGIGEKRDIDGERNHMVE
jgi:hypothetical protein